MFIWANNVYPLESFENKKLIKEGILLRRNGVLIFPDSKLVRVYWKKYGKGTKIWRKQKLLKITQPLDSHH